MKMHKDLIKDIVKSRCKEKGLNLTRLALQLGVSPTYLMLVVHGRNPSRPLIHKIADALELPVLPDIYEQYLKYMRMRRKHLKKFMELLDAIPSEVHLEEEDGEERV
jgi:transcriptional regulator with XRE-family HTH domain